MRNVVKKVMPACGQPKLAVLSGKQDQEKDRQDPKEERRADVALIAPVPVETSQATAPAYVTQEHGPYLWRVVLEPLVAAVYAKRTGYKVRRVGAIRRHPARPELFAHVGWEVLDAPEVQLLECLGVGAAERADWDRGVPNHVAERAQLLMTVTGVGVIDLAVMFLGQELLVYRIPLAKDLKRIHGREFIPSALPQPDRQTHEGQPPAL